MAWVSKCGASSITAHTALRPNRQPKTFGPHAKRWSQLSHNAFLTQAQFTTQNCLGSRSKERGQLSHNAFRARSQPTTQNCRGTHPPLFHRSEHSRRPTAHQASTVTPMLHLDAFLCPLLSHVELWLTCRAQISRRQETCGSKKRTCKTVGEPKRVNG